MTYAAVAALIASLMPLGARYGWAFDLAANFRVQYVAVDALLAVACALQRKPIWCLALAACAVFSVRPVLPYVALPIDAVAAAPVSQHTVKVLSANVLFENHSAKRLLEIVREESPDIVATRRVHARVGRAGGRAAHRLSVPPRRAGEEPVGYRALLPLRVRLEQGDTGRPLERCAGAASGHPMVRSW